MDMYASSLQPTVFSYVRVSEITEEGDYIELVEEDGSSVIIV